MWVEPRSLVHFGGASGLGMVIFVLPGLDVPTLELLQVCRFWSGPLRRCRGSSFLQLPDYGGAPSDCELHRRGQDLAVENRVCHVAALGMWHQGPQHVPEHRCGRGLRLGYRGVHEAAHGPGPPGEQRSLDRRLDQDLGAGRRGRYGAALGHGHEEPQHGLEHDGAEGGGQGCFAGVGCGAVGAWGVKIRQAWSSSAWLAGMGGRASSPHRSAHSGCRRLPLLEFAALLCPQRPVVCCGGQWLQSAACCQASRASSALGCRGWTLARLAVNDGPVSAGCFRPPSAATGVGGSAGIGGGGPDSGPDPTGGWSRFRPRPNPRAGGSIGGREGAESASRGERTPLGETGPRASPKGAPDPIPRTGLVEHVGYTRPMCLGPGPMCLMHPRLGRGIASVGLLRGLGYSVSPRPAETVAVGGCRPGVKQTEICLFRVALRVGLDVVLDQRLGVGQVRPFRRHLGGGTPAAAGVGSGPHFALRATSGWLAIVPWIGRQCYGWVGMAGALDVQFVVAAGGAAVRASTVVHAACLPQSAEALQQVAGPEGADSCTAWKSACRWFKASEAPCIMQPRTGAFLMLRIWAALGADLAVADLVRRGRVAQRAQGLRCLDGPRCLEGAIQVEVYSDGGVQNELNDLEAGMNFEVLASECDDFSLLRRAAAARRALRVLVCAEAEAAAWCHSRKRRNCRHRAEHGNLKVVVANVTALSNLHLALVGQPDVALVQELWATKADCRI